MLLKLLSGRHNETPPGRKSTFSHRAELGMQQHWLSHGGPRSPALRGVRGRADRKGGCCGARGAASGGARAERLRGRGLRSGAASPEPRERGDGAAYLRSASSGREGDAAGRDCNSPERALLGEARGKNRVVSRKMSPEALSTRTEGRNRLSNT